MALLLEREGEDAARLQLTGDGIAVISGQAFYPVRQRQDALAGTLGALVHSPTFVAGHTGDAHGPSLRYDDVGAPLEYEPTGRRSR